MAQNGTNLLQLCYHPDIATSLDNIYEQCPICFNEIMEPKLTNCNHKMCTSCLDTWLLTKNTCPLCRRNIITHQNISIISVDESRLRIFATAFNLLYYLNGVVPPTYSS